MALQYFILYKPYNVLSQFTRETPQQQTLADVDFDFPRDAYPVGRLDADSEGLLLLTNDKSLNDKLLSPKNQHPRTYWVQVEGIPDDDALDRLKKGVSLKIDGKTFQTQPAQVRLLTPPVQLPARNPPVRFRKTVPDTWIALTLTEGKNRQVRRMCAAVGFPVLRLVRVKIGALAWGDAILGEMQPGNVKIIEKADIR